MPGLNGTGPAGEGRPGRGLGRCGKAKQDKRSDIGPRSGTNRDTDTASGRRAGRGRGGLRRCGRM